MSEEKPENRLTQTQEALLDKHIHLHTQDDVDYELRFVASFSQPPENAALRVLLTSDDELYACDEMLVLKTEFPHRIDVSVCLNLAVDDHFQWAIVAWNVPGTPELDDSDQHLLVTFLSGKHYGTS